MSPKNVPAHQVVVIGAGFGGIAAGVHLLNAGIEDFVIVDKHPKVGGTWFINRYPGAAVDIPSFIYSFSFAQKGSWSRLFAPQEELQAYAEEVVDSYGLRDRLKLSTTVTSTRFDGEADIWRIETDRGTLTARFVIAGVGGLEVPNLPDIPGADSFTGKLLHTTQWDDDYDLADKHVAVIGTGATALQLIPSIADNVSQLKVFQRTAIWVAPKPDFVAGPITKWVLGNRFARLPLRGAGMLMSEIGLGGALLGGQYLGRRVHASLLKGVGIVLRGYIFTQLPRRPDLRRKLTPTYAFGCKRPSMHNRWFTTFAKPNVELITDSIERIDADAIVTNDGRRHVVDAIVCATGFKVMERGATPPFPCLGIDSVDLNTWWHHNRFQAYQGVSVPGWPNAFLLVGPWAYSPGSYLVLLESTATHAVRVIAEALRRGATRCDVREEPHNAYMEKMRERASKSHLSTPLCAGSNTYYLNYQGDPAAYRPSTSVEMRWQNAHFPLSHYRFDVSTPNGASAPRPEGIGECD